LDDCLEPDLLTLALSNPVALARMCFWDVGGSGYPKNDRDGKVVFFPNPLLLDATVEGANKNVIKKVLTKCLITKQK
jgi:hypothetical protein